MYYCYLTTTNKDRGEIGNRHPDPYLDRYSHLGNMKKLLFQCQWLFDGAPDCEDERDWPEKDKKKIDWDEADEITFRIPKPIALKIAEMIEEGIDCFSPTLEEKLDNLQNAAHKLW